MTSTSISLGEILFGEEFKIAVNTEVEAQVKAEQLKIKKEGQFKQLKNLLNLIKRVPRLKDEDYAQILDGITPLIVKKTKLALSQKKRIDMEKQLVILFFKGTEINQKDQKQLTKIIAD